MPNWTLRLKTEYDDDGSGGLTLWIMSCTPNSHDITKKIYVNHPFLVPHASYNERCWKAWIRDRLADVWNHEIGEFLLFDGVREFGPHHGNGENPYIVWHVGDLSDTQVKAGYAKE